MTINYVSADNRKLIEIPVGWLEVSESKLVFLPAGFSKRFEMTWSEFEDRLMATSKPTQHDRRCRCHECTRADQITTAEELHDYCEGWEK